jgi:hypothetical protein
MATRWAPVLGRRPVLDDRPRSAGAIAGTASPHRFGARARDAIGPASVVAFNRLAVASGMIAG